MSTKNKLERSSVSSSDEHSLRNELLESVEGVRSTKKLINLLDGSTSKRRQQLLHCVSASSFRKSHARRFFACVLTFLEPIVEHELFVPDNDDGYEHDDGALEALNFMKVVSFTLTAYMEGLVQRRKDKHKDISVINEIFLVVERLHESLFSLQECGDKGVRVQTEIIRVCELWWTENFMDRECVVVQLLPLLVARSLDESAQKTDVKRLLPLKEALDALDFDDESSADLKSLLLRTLSSPLFLKSNEGKKWIVEMFSIPALASEMHQAIRIQIPDAKKTVLQAYGDIYFRSWKEGGNDVRAALEEFVLQDLAYASIHVANPQMVKNLQTILNPFYNAKKAPDVEKLLHRLFGPILWRSMSAANSRVRVNAAIVLAEVFPLQESAVHTGRAVQKGRETLEGLLTDDEPRVRVAGAEATARILSTYWDVLPSSDIRILLNRALTAITMLVQAEESHGVLRALLPSLGNLIHDRVERVRLAAVRLLLKVKSIKGIKYYHVVPVQHLLARLAEEGRAPRNPTNPVASGLTALMMNSYFPQEANGVEQVKRSLALMSSDPIAATVFYSNLASHLAVNSCAKLVAMMLKCLVAAVDNDKDHSSSDIEDDPLTPANTGLMATLAESICSLWESIEASLKLPAYAACNDFLVEAFSGAVLSNVNAHFEEQAEAMDSEEAVHDCHRVCSAILRCAGRLSPEHVDGLATQVTKKLESVSDDAPTDLTPHIALLCLWGMTMDVAKSLSSSLMAAFGEDAYTSPSFDDVVPGTRKRRSVSRRKGAVPSLPAAAAMRILEDILRGADPSSVAARDALLSSTVACIEIEGSLESGTACAERLLLSGEANCLSESDVELVLRACEAFGRLALHRVAFAGPSNDTLSVQARILLDWTTKKVAPAVKTSRASIGSPLRDLELSHIANEPSTPVFSPNSLAQRRQRLSRSQPRDRLEISIDASFLEPAPEVLSQRAAVSLMQSSCLIFSEWLAVGGSGGEVIAAAVSSWCDLFRARDSRRVVSDLLPSVLRLVTQICRRCGEFQVLETLLRSCGNVEADDLVATALQKAVASLLTSRGDDCVEEMMEGTVAAVTSAALELVCNDAAGENELEELPSSLGDVWSWDKECILCVFAALLTNSQAIRIFADRLIKRVTQNNAGALFAARCLLFMGDNASTREHVRKAMGSFDGLQSMDMESSIGKGVSSAMNQLLDSVC